MKPRTTRIIVIASIVAVVIATAIGTGLSLASSASAASPTTSASQSSSAWATASAEKQTARETTADAERRQAVDDAVKSVSALSSAEKDADGKVGEGDKNLLTVDATALNDHIKKAVVSFTYGDATVVEIHQQTAAVKSVKTVADDAVKKIEKAVADETERKAAEAAAAKKRAEEAAAAARSAASAASQSASTSSSTTSSTRTTQSTDSYSPVSGDVGTAVPGATYYMYVSGYCGNSGCAQSAVDNNVLAYIDFGTGLYEIAGHVNSQISSLNVGNTVRVTGSGAGLYQVTSIVWTFKGATTSDVPSGFAFQTCVGSQMKLAYAQRIG